jgi:branched-chain amino acid transport system permease protein
VEDYFISCTLGMGVILFSVMNNWMELTRGPLGIPGIPPVSFFGHELTAKWEQLDSSPSPLLGRGGEGF